jgi:broad specificity phosphatase PhoE
MKIFLVRHGETTGDVEDRYGGSYDDHLTDLGKEQLAVTANSLVGKDIEIILTSPLIRAKESAEIISSKIECPVEIMSGLEERSYGVLGGLTKVEALEKYPEVVEAHKDPLNTDPEGENYDDFKNRVLGTFQKITQKEHNTIAVVSHGGPIKQILAHLGESIPDKIGDGGIIEVNI